MLLNPFVWEKQGASNSVILAEIWLFSKTLENEEEEKNRKVISYACTISSQSIPLSLYGLCYYTTVIS